MRLIYEMIYSCIESKNQIKTIRCLKKVVKYIELKLLKGFSTDEKDGPILIGQH